MCENFHLSLRCDWSEIKFSLQSICIEALKLSQRRKLWEILLWSFYVQLPIKRHKRCVNILIYTFASRSAVSAFIFLFFLLSCSVLFNIKWEISPLPFSHISFPFSFDSFHISIKKILLKQRSRITKSENKLNVFIAVYSNKQIEDALFSFSKRLFSPMATGYLNSRTIVLKKKFLFPL